MTHDLMTRTVPLSALAPSEANVRTTGQGTGIDALAASIRAQGLLQNLVVSPDGDRYRVEAGARRFAALTLLAEQGFLHADYFVPVTVIDPQDSTAASLAENVQRQAMHPADEYEAFQRLTGEGWTIDRIADAFGVTPLVVERRLKLAAAAPELIEQFRAGELSTEQMIALCATEDHERQVMVWNNCAGRHWLVEPDSLRKAVLADDEIDASRDKRIGFIGGLDAYRAAGGEVRRDLFTGDGNGGFIADGALLDKLVADKLDETAAEVRDEGWGWVELWPEFDWQEFHRLGRAPASDDAMPEDVREKIAALEAEEEALAEEDQAIWDAIEDEADDAQSARMEAIEERRQNIGEELEELREANSSFSPKVKAKAGAIVAFHQGELRIERGMVKSADRKAVAAAAGNGEAVSGGRETESAGRKTDAVSDALRRSLLGHRNLAAQIETAAKPDVAKVLLACWTVKHVRAETSRSYHNRVNVPSDLGISCNFGEAVGTRTSHNITDDAGEVKQAAFSETCKRLVTELPKADGLLWGALAAMTGEELDRIIAHGVALSVSLSEKHTGMTASLLDALGFDMTAHFTATAENYLGKVSKPLIVAALAEAGKVKGDAAKAALLAKKKGELAKEAETLLAGSGWVPATIRAPKPKGAAVSKPAKPAKAKTAAKAGAKAKARKAT